MAHAKVLASIPDKFTQIKVFYKILAGGLSVKKTEQLVQDLMGEEKKEKKQTKTSLPEEYVQWRDSLKKGLNTKVDLKVSKEGKGKLVINFDNEEQLKQIMNKLKLASEEE